jgi:hypothetical protein
MSAPWHGGPARTVLVVLLAAHVAFGLLRLPGKVWGRRADDIARYRDDDVAFLLDGARLGGADAIRWLRTNVPPNGAVMYAPPISDAMEFAAALLTPRLLVHVDAVPSGVTTWAGRVLAHGTLPDGTRGFVVVQGSDDRGLTLRVRER